MVLKKISVKNFRNIKEAELELGENCNILFGGNAQGKTNMLEAFSICLGRSFRGVRSSAFVPFGKNNKNTRISLYFTGDNKDEKINRVKYELNGEGKARVTLNDIPMKNAQDLYGELKYVSFIPEDLFLIKGAPELRRNYIDNIASLQNKSHKKITAEYKNALHQRNILCHDIKYRGRDRILYDLLSDWNSILAKQGVNITYGRLKYFTLLKKYAAGLYSEISGHREKLEMVYDSNIFGEIGDVGEIDFKNKKILYELYIKKLNEEMDSLNAQGDFFTKTGPHRDDIIFTINGSNAREYGSQGQLRSTALMMKLSEAEIIRDYNKERPVILLDEVLGELDEKRRGFVTSRFDSSQVLLTSCNINDFNGSGNTKVWRTENGEFIEI